MSASNVAAELLSIGLGRNPDAPAYFCAGDVLTYRGLARAAARSGRLLAELGLAPGDRVALVLHDTLAAPAAFLGAMLLGACPVFLSTGLRLEDYAFILKDSGAKALLAAEDHPAASQSCPGCKVVACGPLGPPGLESLPADLTPAAPQEDAPGFMLYTSGSTGQPKGVPHAQGDLLVPARGFAGMLGVREEDRFFSASKLSFAYGLIANLILPLSRGTAAVLYPGRPDPEGLFATISHRRPTLFFGVPTLYNLMLRGGDPGQDLQSIRLFFSAGEALPPATAEAWQALTGREIVNGLGSTEAMNVYIANELGHADGPEATGRLVPGYEARLVDEEGRGAGLEGRGRLQVRGEGVCRAYWLRPDKTARTMLPDGWLETGDVFEVRDGVFFHQGRADDMIKAGAHWVAPLAVENALLTHPAVAECAVAGCRVEGLERPLAHVVLRPGSGPGPALERALRLHVRGLLPEYMCPARVEFVDSLPKTPTGKIQRFALRRSDGPAAPQQPQTPGQPGPKEHS